MIFFNIKCYKYIVGAVDLRCESLKLEQVTHFEGFKHLCLTNNLF